MRDRRGMDAGFLPEEVMDFRPRHASNTEGGQRPTEGGVFRTPKLDTRTILDPRHPILLQVVQAFKFPFRADAVVEVDGLPNGEFRWNVTRALMLKLADVV